MVVAHLEFGDTHVTCCESSGFTYADIMEHCASLDSFNVLDQNVIFLEFIDRKGHSNGDSKRKTFRDSYHHKNNGNNGNFDSFLESLIAPEGLIFQYQYF